MRARVAPGAVLCALLLCAAPLASCGDDDDATEGGSTISPTTAVTVPRTGTTQTPSTDPPPSSEPPGSPVPPVTPPPGQPEACTVLSAAAGLDPAELEPVDDPAGEPAPSTGCRSTSGMTLSIFYGQDPLETLALVRVQQPGGTDVPGLGQDAYESGGVLYVDAGSRAFAVTAPARDELTTLAQGVIDNL